MPALRRLHRESLIIAYRLHYEAKHGAPGYRTGRRRSTSSDLPLLSPELNRGRPGEAGVDDGNAAVRQMFAQPQAGPFGSGKLGITNNNHARLNGTNQCILKRFSLRGQPRNHNIRMQIRSPLQEGVLSRSAEIRKQKNANAIKFALHNKRVIICFREVVRGIGVQDLPGANPVAPGDSPEQVWGLFEVLHTTAIGAGAKPQWTGVNVFDLKEIGSDNRATNMADIAMR